MTRESHRHFHDELARLKEKVLAMSGRAESALGDATQAFFQGDLDLGTKIVDQDEEIDRLEIEIDEMVASLLALHQPVAKDLRLILAVLKISNDLERVGDHAVNIGKSAARLRAADVASASPELVRMADLCKSMLRNALNAFVRSDAKIARDVCQVDDEVDSLHRTIFELVVKRVTTDSSTVDRGMELLLVSRNLERVADLATNISEDVVYLVEGMSIKHGGSKRL